MIGAFYLLNIRIFFGRPKIFHSELCLQLAILRFQQIFFFLKKRTICPTVPSGVGSKSMKRLEVPLLFMQSEKQSQIDSGRFGSIPFPTSSGHSSKYFA